MSSDQHIVMMQAYGIIVPKKSSIATNIMLFFAGVSYVIRVSPV